MKTRQIDFLKGSLFSNILIFSVPLIFTNLMQALFTMVDAAIVGRFAGAEALGSVGSTSMMVFFFMGFVTGISGGVNVIVAYYLGAKNQKETDETVFNSFFVCLLSGVILMLLSIFCAPFILKLLQTKPELFENAVIYFRIFMLSLPFASIFNFGNAILRAAGETKRPLVYLAIAGIANVILDILFVAVFKWNVKGVAIATVISQIISAALVLIDVLKGINKVKLNLKNQQLNQQKIIKILKIGVPAGLQSAFFAFANMFIQFAVNSFDAITVSGIAAAEKCDAFVYNIVDAVYAACACFIGQNFGANQKKRVLKSFWISQVYSFFVSFTIGGFFWFFGKYFLSIFTSDPQVIAQGLQRIKIMGFSYCITTFMDNSIAASRGLGKTTIPTIFVITGSCIFRIIWIFTVFAHFKSIKSLYLLFSASWIITGTAEIIYFFCSYKKCFKTQTNSSL